MKLVSYAIKGPIKAWQRIGLLVDDQILDLNLAYRHLLVNKKDAALAQKKADLFFPEDMLGFFGAGEPGFEAAKNILNIYENDPGRILSGTKKILFDRSQVRLLAPVPRPNTIRDFSTFIEHQKRVTLKKSGGSVPDVFFEIPVYWKANPDNTIGPDDVILWPNFSEKLDYELEFGVYISKRGKDIGVDDAADYIAGYTIFNDISARDQQEKEMVMTFGPAKGKDFDNSEIFGPCMVTPDEFNSEGNKMIARINGEVWSESTTDGMLWTFSQMISYVSQSETLFPGDFLASGTCPTGCGIELDRWIQPGDVIELEIEGIGILRNRVVRNET